MNTSKARYFPHMIHTRNDKKIRRLIAKHGAIGYAVYFYLLEELGDTNDYELELDEINFFAADFRVGVEVFQSVIHDFNLFEIEGKYFFSPAFKRNMIYKNEKSRKSREAALKRWNVEKNMDKTIDLFTGGGNEK